MFGTDPNKSDFGKPVKLHIMYSQGNIQANFLFMLLDVFCFSGNLSQKAAFNQLITSKDFGVYPH
jgi:hypothetical protein